MLVVSARNFTVVPVQPGVFVLLYCTLPAVLRANVSPVLSPT